MAHWYNTEAKLVKDATVREARQYDLVSGVMDIIGILENYGLSIWKMEQAAIAGFTMPRPSGTPDYEFVKLIIEDGLKKGKIAAEWGSQMHALLERKLENIKANLILEESYDQATVLGFQAVAKWIDENIKKVLYIEYAAVSDRGYAGTIDAIVELIDGSTAMIDWKTQGTKLSGKLKGKFTFYREWAWQLAAYRPLSPVPIDKCISVAISSTDPGLIQVKEWKDEKIDEGWKIFHALLMAFKLINKL